MRRFLIRGQLFLLPLIILLGLPLALLIRAGELVSPRDAVARQQEDARVLFGLAYSNPVKPYKLEATIARVPRTLVLGNSRVLQFRSAVFREPESFFNAGLGVSDLPHYSYFLDQIPGGAEPHLIIAGVDHSMFNDAWRRQADDRVEDLYVPQGAHLNLMASWRKVYHDVGTGRAPVGQIARGGPHMGVQAIVHHQGFRHDGSYRYGEVLRDPDNPALEDHDFRDTMSRIRRGNRRFEYGDSVSPSALTALDRFLGECARRRIEVVGFLPPFPPRVLDALGLMRERYGYLDDLAPAVATVFRKHGFAFYDYTDVRPLGATDSEFIDGLHGSEKVYLRMLAHMANSHPGVRQAALDVDELTRILRDAQSDLEVIDDDTRPVALGSEIRRE